MAIFYVLPPRPLLGDLLADALATWLPGLHWDEETRENLCEAVRSAATCQPDVYLVFRDELPEGIATAEALRDVCGATEGDEIVEVRSGQTLPLTRRWSFRLAA